MTVNRPPPQYATRYYLELFRIAEKNIRSFSFAALATKHGRRDTVNEVCASAATLELIELKAEKASVKVSEANFQMLRAVGSAGACPSNLLRHAHEETEAGIILRREHADADAIADHVNGVEQILDVQSA